MQAAIAYLSRSEESLGILLPASASVVSQISPAVDAFVCHIYSKSMQQKFGEGKFLL